MATEGQIKERKDAKRFGAKLMPRSGGLWFAKGDSKDDRFLTDSKKTKHKGYTITLKTWEKIEYEALLSNRIPMLSIEFGDEKKELVILDTNDFDRLLELI